MSLRRRRRAATTTLAVAVLAGVLGFAGGLAPGMSLPAAAHPDGTDVVINEVYTRGGSEGQPFSHKFVELYNPTETPVSLDGWSLQYRSAKNSGVNKANLAGTIPAQGHFLVQGGQNSPNAGPAGDPLPTPDLANVSINPAASNGIVFLVRGTANLSLPDGDLAGSPEVVDLVGYGSAAVFEGNTAQSPAFVGSIERTHGIDTDDNAADFTAIELPTPTNSGQTPPPGPASEAADDADEDRTTTSGCRHVPNGQVAISEIQGEGSTTPFQGCLVETTGIITATYPQGGFDGVVIQTPGTGGQIDLETHTASHAVFVRDLDLARKAEAGDHVSVRGYAEEYYGLTQLARVKWDLIAEPAEPVTPAEVPWPATDEERERLEGMLIAPRGPYVVTDLYESGTYATIGLAFGDEPLRTPTDYARPGTAQADAITADNAARRVTLDDGSTWRYPNFDRDYHQTPLPYLSHDEPVRIGASVTFHEPVILDWRNGEWKFQPTRQVTGETSAEVVTFEDTRTDPPEVGGNLVVGTFNVENYFVDLGEQEPGCEARTDRHGEPSASKGCRVRGAYDAAGLQRQSAKLVAGITASGAHVLALQELQNTHRHPSGDSPPLGVHSRDVALSRLVEELNAESGSGTWAYVPSPAELPRGEDVIRNAYIYRVADVEPVGPSIILDDAAFRYGREPLAQAFSPAGGEADEGDPATTVLLVTTHLKSKRSGTGEDADHGDGQGASNTTRVRQTRALADFVDGLLARGATPNVLLLGDFNAHTREDPMEELYDRGYVNLTSGPDAVGAAGTGGDGLGNYSFAGELGSLDHILANAAASGLVTGAGAWRINAFESPALEYSRANHNVLDLYRPSPYRSSDHDPLFVGLRLDVPEAVPAPEPEPEVEPEEAIGMSTAAWIVIGLVAIVVIITRRGSRGRSRSR